MIKIYSSVRVVSKPPEEDNSSFYIWIDQMCEFLGTEGTVSIVHPKSGFVSITNDNGKYTWSPKWLEEI